MNLSELISEIHEELLKAVPLFRIAWIGTIVLGIAAVIIALILKNNSERKEFSWIVGGIGLVMAISSGTQLFVSLF
jgi:hypothetical protein